MEAGLEQLVRGVAIRHDIPPDVLCGLVLKESSGRFRAVRHEPGYRNWERPMHFAAVTSGSTNGEMSLQRHSWGLGQIMGATARRFGFEGWLPDLCDYENRQLNLELACMHLRRDLNQGVSLKTALARYNGGYEGNPRPDGTLRQQGYVDAVLKLAAPYA